METQSSRPNSNQGISYFGKMVSKERSPLKVNVLDVATGLVGGFITIFVLAILTKLTSAAWLMAPFGASCVLAFGAWKAPLSQPRNIIGGHFLSTLVGLVVFHSLGSSPWTWALGVGLAIALMMLTKTTHPPAGADPLVVIMQGSAWSFLVSPVLIGSVVVVILALIINNVRTNRSYPVFWI